MRCNRCGEPWDLDSLHDEISAQHGDEIDRLKTRLGDNYWRDPRFDKAYAKYFDAAREAFRKQGCGYFGCKCEATLEEGPRAVLDMISELNGSDVDGAECDIEDAEALGLI